MKKLILITALLASSSSWGACINGDCINGIGTFTYVDGDKYVGEHQDNKPHGQGTFTWADGDKYVGEWKDNNRHGQGTHTYASGNNYVGEWKDNKYHGQGTYTYASGNNYVGEFQDGNMHGQGTLTYTYDDRLTQTGVWENGSYFGTKAEWDAKRKAMEEARQKYNRIYNACLLDKSSDVDMQVSSLRIAVEETCEAIAEDPSWYENWKYN